MQRYLLILSYDGSNYCGWQIQKNTANTIGQILENVLYKICKQKIIAVASGRTDSKVHALYQPVHFDFPISSMTENQILLALRSLLPKDIFAQSIQKVNKDFSARFDAISRTYNYYIGKNFSPFKNNYQAFYLRKKINPKFINACLPYFLGEKDFTSFCKINPEIPNRICNVQEISFKEEKEEYIFCIKANRFLHNMVRRIVGTLINLSDKNYPKEIIPEIFLSKKTDQKYIYTAHPQGLYLTKVEYENIYFLKS